MKPSVALQGHREEIRRVVEAHRAKNARIFGSAARGEDTEESDLDLLGVKVDVLTPGALTDRMRDTIIAGAIPV